MIPIRPLLAFFLLTGPAQLCAETSAGSVQTTVKTVTLDPRSNSPVVLLESIDDKKLLPIWIGAAEAQAIAIEIEGVKPPRPLTHDLIRALLNALDASLKRVTITDLRDDTYYAVLTLEHRGKPLEIDSRPSDAIAVALRMKAPIYATTRVLAKAKPLLSGAGTGGQSQEKLGLQSQDLTAELAALLELSQAAGVLVADVAVAGPAAKAGLQRGDLLVRANDQALRSKADLDAVLERDTPVELRLEVIRNGKPIVVVLDLSR